MTGALLLATSPVWAGKTGGLTPPAEQQPTQNQERATPQAGMGKSQIAIDSVSLDKDNKTTVQNCAIPQGIVTPLHVNNMTSLTFDPKKKQVVTLQFAMADIPATKEAHVLVLLYSRCLSAQSTLQISPTSKNQLNLDLKDLDILGSYDVSKTKATSMNLTIDLDTRKLAKQIEAGNHTFYFQAGLLKKSDFEKKKYNGMLLSGVEAILFTPNTCPVQKQLSQSLQKDNASCKTIPTKSK